MFVQSMRDVDFREKYKVVYVKVRKGFYDVLVGDLRKKVGRMVHCYDQWCFCSDTGDSFHYGLTRSDALWNWMMREGVSALDQEVSD